MSRERDTAARGLHPRAPRMDRVRASLAVWRFVDALMGPSLSPAIFSAAEFDLGVVLRAVVVQRDAVVRLDHAVAGHTRDGGAGAEAADVDGMERAAVAGRSPSRWRPTRRR